MCNINDCIYKFCCVTCGTVDCIIFPLHGQDNIMMWGLYELDYIDLLLLFHRQNLIFRVKCSKGTYIRSLCADLGKVLGRYHLEFEIKWLSAWVLCYASFGNHSPFLVFDMMCLVAVVLIWQLCAEIQLVKFSTVIGYLSQKHFPYLSLISSISSLIISYLCLSGEFLVDDAWEFKELEEDIVKGYM